PLRSRAAHPGTDVGDPGTGRGAPVRQAHVLAGPLGRLEPRLRPFALSAQEVDAAALEGYRRIPLEQARPRESVQPALERDNAPLRMERHRDPGEDRRRAV